jgi:hypothetical protein
MPYRLSYIAGRSLASCRHSAGPICLGLMLLALAGCTSLDFSKNLHWPWEKDPAAARMTDMWSFTVLRQPGQPGVRGFGGRLMFYSPDDKPMKVDGTLTVYAFDARSDDPARAVPERKFVFQPENLPKHYSESKLGHSYSFWLPWDEVGGDERQITLAARFESKTGQVLMSAPSRQILPGAKKDADKEATPAGVANAEPPTRNGVRTVSHQEDVSDRVPDRNITTTTIDLPPSFVRQSLLSGKPTADSSGGALPNADATAVPVASPQPASAAPSGLIREPASPPQAKLSPTCSDSTRQTEPSTRSALSRFPARREATVEPRSDPFRRQPYPGQWPSALPMTPRSGRWREGPDTPSTAPPEPTAVPSPMGQNTQN